MEYQDKQELFFNNLTRILTITNAAEATSEVVEIEARVVASRWLTVNAACGLLDTNYDRFVIPGGAVYTGNPLGSSPHDKLSVGAHLNLALGNWGELFGTVMYSSTSAYFTGASADPALRVPAYDLINLSLGVAPSGGPWTVTAFVPNLEDTDYLLTPSTQAVRAEYLGEPCTVGIALTWSF
jgi:iron complex outermembrane recepter protein